MFRYILKRLLYAIPVFLGITFVIYTLINLAPGGPLSVLAASGEMSLSDLEALKISMGLDKPIVIRYFIWLGDLLHGDFGVSLIYRRPVLDVIKEKFATSLALMMTAWVFSGIIGFAIGCAMGIFNGKWIDKILKKVCLIMCSIPTFWIGIVFLMLFSVQLGWFPMGMSVPKGVPADQVTILQRIHHLILPALTLSFLSFANVALHTREKLVDVLESDYVLFAKARGESKWSILKRHGLRNIMLPAITMQFGSFSELFGGSVLAETVFSYPGLGAAASAAGMGSDIPLLLGITLFSTLFVFVGNMLANIIYGIVDPQIREGYRNE